MDSRLPVVRAYRDDVLTWALAAQVEGVPFAVWVRRALLLEAERVLKGREIPARVTRRALEALAAGLADRRQQVAAERAAAEATAARARAARRDERERKLAAARGETVEQRRARLKRKAARRIERGRRRAIAAAVHVQSAAAGVGGGVVARAESEAP